VGPAPPREAREGPGPFPGAVLSPLPPRFAAAVAVLIVAASSSITAVTAKPPTAVAAAIVVAAPNTTAADRASAVAAKRDRADRARRAALPAAAVAPVVEHATVRHTTVLRNPHRAAVRRPARQAETVTWPADGGRAAVVIGFALAQVGKPYVWAAAGPRGYDCSGLVLAAYARVGIRLPHQTGGIIGYGRHVSRGELQPGDIVFPQAGHVAVYLGNNMIVHAPHRGDHVRVSTLYGFYSAVRLL
jgi:cell wall-associated NlpC family hydrolase